ncbi:hypothetical protein ABZS66_53900 [Dactylosporangium sp. NPDC005572]|uniref:hypothetical protein n=1 Tax=Dactylosporangium sp. NPDC005572 TaxID=3156889 RepID=UPI0033B56327
MRLRLESKRRTILATCATLAVVGPLAVIVPTVAEAGSSLLSRTCSSDPSMTPGFMACVLMQGDEVWATASSSSEWTSTEVILRAQYVECERHSPVNHGACWLEEKDVFQRLEPRHEAVTPRANWRYGRDHYAVVAFGAVVVARVPGVASGRTETRWVSVQYLA